jgi:hypothetical protein
MLGLKPVLDLEEESLSLREYISDWLIILYQNIDVLFQELEYALELELHNIRDVLGLCRVDLFGASYFFYVR